MTDELLEAVEARALHWGGARLGRILGDCHRGNILWTDSGPHFVDLDDCVTGPAVQDLWMLLSGGHQEMRTELRDLLTGYEQFLPFDRREIALMLGVTIQAVKKHLSRARKRAVSQQPALDRYARAMSQNKKPVRFRTFSLLPTDHA